MDALTLGIDVGTGTTKAVLADPHGRVLQSAQSSYRYTSPQPSWVEQDAEDWWEAVCSVTRTLCCERPDAADSIAAVGISGQGVAAVLLAKEGKPLRPAILWLDSRSACEAKELQDSFGERIASVSGKCPATYNVEPKLLWVKRHEPETWRRTWKVMTTAAYVTFRLTGQAVINHSDGGILLAYNLAKNSWSQELLDDMALPASVYCDPVPCHQVIGFVSPEASRMTGLRPGTPVVGGGEDTSAAGLAMGVTSADCAQLSMGSASTLYVPLSRVTLDARLLAFPHVIEGFTLVGGSMVGGGIAMEWAAKILSGARETTASEEYSRLTEEATAVPAGSEGLIFLPYLSGELQPINDGSARAVFFGLDLFKTRGHLVRAVMEGTAYAIAHNLAITRQLGAEVRRLVAVGGPTRNALWCQIIADVTGLPLQVMQERGGAALGDAILAAMGAKLIESPLQMQRAHAVSGALFTPNEERHRRYGQLLEIYMDLYPRLQDLFPRLAGASQLHRAAEC
ncbi:MAG TPA: FGGY family carbohydrate kinase [Terriglobia bacterium]|nr:FGGY family carbohydrate kinase [Terriglobia bacterium]